VVVEVFEWMEALKAQVMSPNFPSAHIIIAGLADKTPYLNLPKYFVEAREYFLENLPDMSLYRAAEYLNPVKVRTALFVLFFFWFLVVSVLIFLGRKRSPSCRSAPLYSDSWETREPCNENYLTIRLLPPDVSMGWTF